MTRFGGQVTCFAYGSNSSQHVANLACGLCTDCRILFLAPTIGSRSLAEHVDLLGSPSTRFSLPELTQIVFLGESSQNFPFRHRCYEDFKAPATHNADNWTLFESQSRNTKPSDILSLQLTSG